MNILQLSTAFALLPATAFAQLVTFGVAGGVPAETPLAKTTTMPFVLGPTVNLKVVRRLPSLSLESGVLFHRLGTSDEKSSYTVNSGATVFVVQRNRANAIEIPLLLKYRFLSDQRNWQPFVAAGPAMRRTSIDFYQSLHSALPLDSFKVVEVDRTTDKWKVDPVVAGGVSFKSGRMYIEPQVRYSYWGTGKHSVIRQNQVHFMFGLRF